ncbi:hypothetical protein BKA67DRAFT_539292 [Truncatella angustata]|uniref:Ecp2 effector protein-like domain-containing protein n=1 Tax=Truncatella angustata TaxID=152316 RepID=A0A9P8RQB7_9PEZI|nr:uncharacterized protein BKA67DRAFT_539292 [Truncatella angustata]KAH6647428.1 hypothetical protein BKA67DRAFT_539292 [Truncatella angustata]KAH8195038.1 hypothetical protein TruAng_010793 [Truncatella angustata]
MLYSSILLGLLGLPVAVLGALDVSTGDDEGGISKYSGTYSYTDLCGDVTDWKNETMALSPLKSDCQAIWRIMNDSPGWIMFANLGEWDSDQNHGLYPLVTHGTCTFAIRPQVWEGTSARLYVGSSDLNGIFNNAPNDLGGIDRVGASGRMGCKFRKSGEPEKEIFFRIYNPNDQKAKDFGDSW